jgi:hypothetical protein
MPITGVRVTGGMMTMLDGELFAALTPLFGRVCFATQLFVPELRLEPSAMFERVEGLVSAEGVTLGAATAVPVGKCKRSNSIICFRAATRGVESPLVRIGDVETEGIRTSPVLA